MLTRNIYICLPRTRSLFIATHSSIVSFYLHFSFWFRLFSVSFSLSTNFISFFPLDLLPFYSNNCPDSFQFIDFVLSFCFCFFIAVLIVPLFEKFLNFGCIICWQETFASVNDSIPFKKKPLNNYWLYQDLKVKSALCRRGFIKTRKNTTSWKSMSSNHCQLTN